MSMEVKIKVGGSVIIYDKEGYWNFVFISDSTHLVRIKVDNTQLVDLGGAGRSRMLKLNIPPDTRAWGSDEDKIFNMGIKGLHDNDGNNSNLEVMSPPNSQSGRSIVRLMVPAGTVAGTKHSDNGSEVWYPQYEYSDLTGVIRGSVGETAKFVTLSCKTTSDLALIEGTKLIKLGNYSQGKAMMVEIDNDCHCEGNYDDFLMYYDWVWDTIDSDKKFIARKPKKSGQVGTESIEGNCDPTRITPPPFP